MKKRKLRYKSAGEKKLIEVRVKEVQQLFDFRDPSPFIERDLSDDFVKYIVSSAQEFSNQTPLRIDIYVEGSETQELSVAVVTEAIRAHLAYELDLSQKRLRAFLRRSQVFFLIGLVILISCLSLAHTLPESQSWSLQSILREGLIIFGWVSMWKPVENLLFDWYPIFEEARLYKKLFETELRIEFNKSSPNR